MELNKNQLTVLQKLSKAGFIGNFYQAFGKSKLAIYKSIGPDRIVVCFKHTELDVDVQFHGLNFLSPLRDKIIEEFQPAIEIYENEIAWWKNYRS
jgi:hypothetical protein